MTGLAHDQFTRLGYHHPWDQIWADQAGPTVIHRMSDALLQENKLFWTSNPTIVVTIVQGPQLSTQGSISTVRHSDLGRWWINIPWHRGKRARAATQLQAICSLLLPRSVLLVCIIVTIIQLVSLIGVALLVVEWYQYNCPWHWYRSVVQLNMKSNRTGGCISCSNIVHNVRRSSSKRLWNVGSWLQHDIFVEQDVNANKTYLSRSKALQRSRNDQSSSTCQSLINWCDVSEMCTVVSIFREQIRCPK